MMWEDSKLQNKKLFKPFYYQSITLKFLMSGSNREQVCYFMGHQELEKHCSVNA